ncbi:hypothetical protein GYMLUDRAFT_40127 [Collybiopsis luxurians FD-317 M1]|uniref:Unplaced genomic scaffold GYMLUscaffold_14, whole genome shotgun sequence n=1 Tax=Collybiopsis luxurians FD-317 M1 TaxID=944289 RepID=A0A0D0BIJ1_9AGAR|nr:hypothetical protein GYMLUDRAFT_40127 [Collybiopsis luxurians FD-317 M1]
MTPAKAPAQKRRKLSSPKLSTTFSPLVALSAHLSTTRNTALACVSCHRRAQSASRSFIVFCARCSSPTCTVCSRTCSASAASHFLNTHLAWSPTPPPSPPEPHSPPHSSRRFALSLNSVNTNSTYGYAQTNAPGKRKKLKEDDPERDETQVRLEDEDENEEVELGRGCGRTICKNCCFENIQNETITCHDCYGTH